MKKFLVLLGLLFWLNAYSQSIENLAKDTKLDFAVPEHPAFSILDNNSDNILRPSNTQEIFSLIYSNFLSGETPIIPKNFSMEFSPAQLIGINKITLTDYRKNGNRILYDSKISVGGKTSSDVADLQSFAIGLRVTWFDKSTLASNTEFLEAAAKILKYDALGYLDFIENLKNQGSEYKGMAITVENTSLDTEMKFYVDSLYEDYKYNAEVDTFYSVKTLRSQYKNETWNKLKFESAFAMKFNSPDSLVSNSYYSKFQLFNTLGLPLGRSGQWLFGLNYSDTRLDSIQQNAEDTSGTSYKTVKYHSSVVTLASRIYFGTNRLKAFIEGSGNFGTDDMIRLGINLGAEVNLSDGIWAMVNFGNNWSRSTDPNLDMKEWTDGWYWKLDIRFKIPEKMKL